MAFDIQRAGGSLPGRGTSVAADADVRTGAGGVVGAIGQAGGALQDVALVLNDLQAENKFTESKRLLGEDAAAFADQMAKEPDSTKYPQMRKDFLSKQKQNRPTDNEKAGRAFDKLVAKATVETKGAILESALTREQDTKRADDALLLTQGKFEMFRKSVGIGVLKGTYSRTAAGKMISDSFHKEQRNAVELIVLGENPEDFGYKTAGAMIKDYPALTPGDFVDLKNMKTGQQSTIVIKDNEAVLKARTETSEPTWQEASNGNFTAAQQLIATASETVVGREWRSDELSKLTKASAMMAETGINPYTDRQDDAAYQIAWQRAVDGDISVTEIDAGIGDKWTVGDGGSLKKIIAGETNKAQDQEQIQAFRDLSTLIGAADTFNAVPGAVQSARIQGRKILEDEIANAEKPLRGEELEMSMFRIVGEMKRRVETGFTPEQLLPTPGKGGTPGRFIESGGQIIGTIDDVGRLVLNRNGIRRLFRLSGSNKARAREIAAERGFVIPGE